MERIYVKNLHELNVVTREYEKCSEICTTSAFRLR